MRALFDARFVLPQPTGIGRYCVELLRGLLEVSDIDVELLRGARPWPDYGIEDLDRSRVRQHVSRYPPQGPGAGLVASRLSDRLEVDVVHHPHALFPAPRVKQPLVATLHDAKHLTGPTGFGAMPAWRRRYLAHGLRRSVGRADAVIAVSAATADDCRTLHPGAASKLTVIHEGVGQRFLADAPGTRAGRRRPYVLCIAEFRPHKNQVRLVEAFMASKASRTHDLILVGRSHAALGDVRSAIARVGGNDRVSVVTDADDRMLMGLLDDAEVFVLPSLYEGFGLPVLEAMARRVPVITSAETACAEVAGDAALLVDPRSVDDLRSAIDRLATDPDLRARLAVRGRQRAERFDWESTARKTVALYEKVAGSAPASRPGGVSSGSRPTVAVVIPARNEEGAIRRAVDSVWRQTTVPEECVVVDDGSTDATAAEAVEAGATVLRGVGGGISYARNLGVRRATSDVIAFLDADDAWLPGYLGAVVDAHSAGADWTVGWSLDVSDTGEPVRVRRPDPEGFSVRDLMLHNPFRPSATAIRRSVLLDVGGFDESILGAEDEDLWLRLLMTGRRPQAVDGGIAYTVRDAPEPRKKLDRTLRDQLDVVAAAVDRSWITGRVAARSRRARLVRFGQRYLQSGHRRRAVSCFLGALPHPGGFRGLVLAALPRPLYGWIRSRIRSLRLSRGRLRDQEVTLLEELRVGFGQSRPPDPRV